MIPDNLLDKVHCIDALALLKMLPDGSVNCIVTSPPYFGLRDYGVDGQIGLEDTPRAFVDRLVTVFAEARRVLRSDGVCWVNMGDSYGTGTTAKRTKGNRGIGESTQSAQDAVARIGGLAKSRLGIPHRLVFALQDDGWIWRDEIIWAKPNPMPESVTDRTTKAHEFVFMLTKEPRYWYDSDAIREQAQEWGERDRTSGKYHNPGTGLQPHTGLAGKPKLGGGGFSKRYAGAQINHGGDSDRKPYETRNRRSVFTIPTEPTPFAHFATFPQALIEPMILAGCPKDGVVLDPFMGSGTTAIVARRLGRHYIGSELNPEYAALANDRLLKDDAVILVEQKTGVSQMSMFELLD